MTIDRDYHNEASQAEKRATIANDRASLHDHAIAQVNDSLGGRFAGAVHKTTVVGTTPGPTYPAQPANSPWHHDPVPTEPSVGYDLSAAPDLGEPIKEPTLVVAHSDSSQVTDEPATKQVTNPPASGAARLVSRSTRRPLR